MNETNNKKSLKLNADTKRAYLEYGPLILFLLQIILKV